VTTLVDGNILIALLVPDHIHHDAAEAWFTLLGDSFATCPATQGAAMRLLIRTGHASSEAQALLVALISDPRHDFWPDEIGYKDVRMEGIIGHRQVTDAYLAQLARVNQGRLATFDEGLAALHSDVAELVPIGA
jgi:uncharacterized protein